MLRFVSNSAISLLAILASFSLLSWLGLWLDLPDIFSHFRIHYALGAAVIAVFFIFSNYRLVLAALLVAGVNLAGTMLPEAVSDPAITGKKLKVLTLNLRHHADNSEAVAALLAAETPDVVLLQEFSGGRLGLLARLRHDYPWQAHCAFDDDCWVAILSRYPIVKKGAGFIGEHAAGLAWMTFGPELGNLSIASVHLRRPISASQHDQATDLASALAGATGPLLVGGDFNSTAWSGAMRRFLSQASLLSTGAFDPTWPRGHVIGRICLLCFPQLQLDHLLISPGLRLVSRRIGPDVGSDHLPMIADLVVPIGGTSTRLADFSRVVQ